MVVKDLRDSYASLYSAREESLMRLAGWPQMDDHMWIQSLAVSTCTHRCIMCGASSLCYRCIYSVLWTYHTHVIYSLSSLSATYSSLLTFPKAAPLSSLSSVELQETSLTVLDVDVAGQQSTLLASLVASLNKTVLYLSSPVN